jgi:TolB-like protein/Flp pilus assembly protein TadD
VFCGGFSVDASKTDRSLLRKPPASSDDSQADTVSVSAASFPPPEKPSPRRSFRLSIRWAAALALTGAIAVMAVSAYFTWRHFRSAPSVAQGKVMLAVLPFQNLTGDPGEDYVSDGFTEEMIHQLGRLNRAQLGVIARTSVMTYKGSHKPVDRIARELHVNYVLEGSVRKTADGLRISTDLIRAQDQTQLWAHEYDRPLGDLVALQGEVAQSVAEEIQIQLTPRAKANLAAARRVNSDAYRYYLQGRFFWNMRSGENLIRAVNAFDQATRQDPGYAPAYAGLADAYNMLIFYGYSFGPQTIPKAKAAALKAVELDASLAEAHASLGYIYFMWEWNWAAAEQEFQRAIELDNSYASAHHWYALYLAALGRRDESLSQIEQARELDPLSLIVSTASAYISYFARRNDEAATQCEDVLQRDPNFMVAHAVLGLTDEARLDFPKAIAEFQKAIQLSGGRPFGYLDYLGHAYAVSGKRAEAEAILAEIHARTNPADTASFSGIGTLIGLGEKELALKAIDKGFAKGAEDMMWLKVDPRVDPLRDDPRFQSLLQRADFPR